MPLRYFSEILGESRELKEEQGDSPAQKAYAAFNQAMLKVHGLKDGETVADFKDDEEKKAYFEDLGKGWDEESSSCTKEYKAKIRKADAWDDDIEAAEGKSNEDRNEDSVDEGAARRITELEVGNVIEVKSGKQKITEIIKEGKMYTLELENGRFVQGQGDRRFVVVSEGEDVEEEEDDDSDDTNEGARPTFPMKPSSATKLAKEMGLVIGDRKTGVHFIKRDISVNKDGVGSTSFKGTKKQIIATLAALGINDHEFVVNKDGYHMYSDGIWTTADMEFISFPVKK